MENLNVCALSGLGCIIYVTLQHWRIVGMNWICFGFVYTGLWSKPISHGKLRHAVTNNYQNIFRVSYMTG